MPLRIMLRALAVIVLLGNSAIARDANGFWVGGGVGAQKCPDFLNAMATARQKGGLKSVAGLREVVPYEYYISGFQITPKQMECTISFRHSGTTLPIKCSTRSSLGARVTLTRLSQPLCLFLPKAFGIS